MFENITSTPSESPPCEVSVYSIVPAMLVKSPQVALAIARAHEQPWLNFTSSYELLIGPNCKHVDSLQRIQKQWIQVSN